MSTVAITGASGFVGSMLAPWLASRGYGVRAYSRNPPPTAPALDGITGLYRVGPPDLTDAAWQTAFRNADCVVHLAALVHQTGATDPRRFEEINVAGTRSILECAIAAGVRRFVYMSTIKVNGESTPAGQPFTAESEPAPMDPYGTSKLAAERIVREACASGRIEAVVIRPVLVYGPGVRANFARLVGWVRRGLPLPFGAIRNVRSLLYAENLCDLVDACIYHERAVGEVFLAADVSPVSTPELVRGLAAGLGVHPRLYPVPVPVLNALAAIIGRRQVMRRLTDSLVVDISKNQRLLGWTPPVSTAEGLARTAAWFRERQRS